MVPHEVWRVKYVVGLVAVTRDAFENAIKTRGQRKITINSSFTRCSKETGCRIAMFENE